MKKLFRRKLTEKEKIFELAGNILQKNFDFLEITKKLQEIEKLKQIIFEPHQIKLFEFLSKPVLYISGKESKKKKNEFKKKNEVEIVQTNEILNIALKSEPNEEQGNEFKQISIKLYKLDEKQELKNFS